MAWILQSISARRRRPFGSSEQSQAASTDFDHARHRAPHRAARALSSEGRLTPMRKDQPPPDLRYFKGLRK
jgi:hypothetical protein